MQKMYKDIHGNDQDEIWDSENLGIEVDTEGFCCIDNALFLKLGSWHMLVILFLYIEIFNTFFGYKFFYSSIHFFIIIKIKYNYIK